MPRAIVSKKGKLKKIVPPVTGVPHYIADGMADSMKYSRPLTRKEMNFIEKRLHYYAEKKGNGDVKVTRDENGIKMVWKNGVKMEWKK